MSDSNSTAAVRAGSVYALQDRIQAISPELKLRNASWGVLFAIDGRRTAGQIREQLGFAEDFFTAAIEELEQKGLIKEQPVDAREFVANQARSGQSESRSLAEFLFSGTLLSSATASPVGEPVSREKYQAESEQKPAPASAPAPLTVGRPFTPLGADGSNHSGSGNIRPALTPLPTPTRQIAASAQPVAIDGAAAAVTAQTSAERRLSLQGVVDFILNRAVDSNAGQLDVYKVFIRINTRLLKRNGIHSLRFKEDRIITDPELQQAILSSVNRTLGVSCPESVFV